MTWTFFYKTALEIKQHWMYFIVGMLNHQIPRPIYQVKFVFMTQQPAIPFRLLSSAGLIATCLRYFLERELFSSKTNKHKR